MVSGVMSVSDVEVRDQAGQEPNMSSGGRMADTDVDEFLRNGASGPEYAALRRLIGNPGKDTGLPTT